MDRYHSKRKGALGAVMDLYEEEANFIIKMLDDSVKSNHWAVIVDKETKDEDCRSIKSICQHIVSAANYYVELAKKGEDANYKIINEAVDLPSKEDFEPQFRKALQNQINHFEGRWELSDDEIKKIIIKTGWGNILDPDSLLEHAVLHIMRHHRQILRFNVFLKENI